MQQQAAVFANTPVACTAACSSTEAAGCRAPHGGCAAHPPGHTILQPPPRPAAAMEAEALPSIKSLGLKQDEPRT